MGGRVGRSTVAKAEGLGPRVERFASMSSTFEPWMVMPIAQQVPGGPLALIGVVVLVLFVALVMV